MNYFCTINAKEDVCVQIYNILISILEPSGYFDTDPTVTLFRKSEISEDEYDNWDELPETWIEVGLPDEYNTKLAKAGIEAILKENIKEEYIINFK